MNNLAQRRIQKDRDQSKYIKLKTLQSRRLLQGLIVRVYHSFNPEGSCLVSPSNDATMSPPGSPMLCAAENEPKKLTSPIVVRNP